MEGFIYFKILLSRRSSRIKINYLFLNNLDNKDKRVIKINPITTAGENTQIMKRERKWFFALSFGYTSLIRTWIRGSVNNTAI